MSSGDHLQTQDAVPNNDWSVTVKTPAEITSTDKNVNKKKSTVSEHVELKRELGLFSAVSMILGVMIGSGIFVSPGLALEYTGSVGFCVIIWAVCGIISLIGALAFAELGTVVPRSGAEYAYFVESFGSLHKFWGPMPAFICAWVHVVILRPAEVAVITLVFAEYALQPFLDHSETSLAEKDIEAYRKYLAYVTIITITTINVSSVKLYVKIQNVFSAFKILACLVVVAGGVYQLARGKTELLENTFEGTKTNPGNLALAFYSGLWAYDGWSSVTTVTEEVKNPSKNIPRSILISVPLVTVLYVFMNIAYMSVLSKAVMTDRHAPIALEFGEEIFGDFSVVIPIGVSLSTFGCALSIQFGVTRLCYVAGQEGHMLKLFSFVHITRLTPAPAVVFQGLVSLMFIIKGDIKSLIEFASFLIWIFYGLAMVSLIVLRYTRPSVPRPYKVPIIIPYFVGFVALFLSLCPIISEPSPKYFFAIGFIIFGVLFVYTPFIYNNWNFPGLKAFERFIQSVFQVVPPATGEDKVDHVEAVKKTELIT